MTQETVPTLEAVLGLLEEVKLSLVEIEDRLVRLEGPLSELLEHNRESGPAQQLCEQVNGIRLVVAEVRYGIGQAVVSSHPKP